MRRLLPAISVSFAAILLALGSPQNVPEATETIGGTVTREDTKTVLPNTRVEIELVDYVRVPTGHERVCKPEPESELTDARRFVMTDVNGKFTFTNVLPGRYYLTAQHEGYLRAGYGQKSGSPLGTVLEIGPQRDTVLIASDTDVPTILVDDRTVVPISVAPPPRGGLGSQQQGVSAGAPTAIRDGTIAQTGQRGGLGTENERLPQGAGVRSAIQDSSPGDPKIDLQNLPLSMTPAPTISGRVVNERGAPLAAAVVQAYQFRYTPMNGRTLKTVRSTLTGDDGKYRLFWLDPGRYVVAAANSSYQLQPWMKNLMLTPNLPNPDAGLPVVFYAASTTAPDALPVPLRRGLEPVADFHLQDRPRKTLRVQLTGNLPPNPRLVFVPYGGDLCAGADYGISAKGQGAFEIRDVPEGLYVMMVMSGRDSVSDVVTVRVGRPSEPQEEIRVPLVAPVEVRGNIQFDRIPPNTSPGQLRVSLVRAGQELSQIETTVVDPATGRFAIHGVGPGAYYPVVDMPPGAYVQNITASNFDLNKPDDCDPDPSKAAPVYAYQDLHGHFDPQKPFRIPEVIPKGAECLNIRISFGNHPLYGIVRDKALKPVKGALVVAIPKSVWAKDLDKGATPPDRYLTGVTDDSGYFQLVGVADQAFSIAGQTGQVPAEYHLYAFEDIDPNVIYDPEFSDRFMGHEPFEVRELRLSNGRWLVIRIERWTVATANSCPLDARGSRAWCYLTVISAEESSSLLQ